MKLKRIIVSITVMVAIFLIAGCQFSGTKVMPSGLKTTEEVYAFSILSTTSLLHQEVKESDTVAPLALTSSYRPTALSNEEELVVEAELDEVNKYLNMMERFLSNNNALAVTIEPIEGGEYEQQLEVETKNLLGEVVVYRFYFNEIAINDDEVEEDDDEDEDEIEVRLEGKMEYDGVEFILEGKREIEDDEEKITFRSYIDDANYVKTVYKTEDDEKKFKFEVVVDGKVVNRTDVKVEEEDDEFKVKLSFIEGEAKGEYEFKRESEDGEETIKIEYKTVDSEGKEETGEIKVKVVVDEITGETSYEYQIKSEKQNRIHQGRRDDDEDEDEDEDEEDEDIIEDDEADDGDTEEDPIDDDTDELE